MERFYDGDQEALFKAAHVINPYMVPKKEPKVSLIAFVSRARVNELHTHIWILSQTNFFFFSLTFSL
jgi:hypothetical protein